MSEESEREIQQLADELLQQASEHREANAKWTGKKKHAYLRRGQAQALERAAAQIEEIVGDEDG